MILEYNGKTYYALDTSIYTDFSIQVSSLEEACEVVTEFDGMTEYVFNLIPHANLVVDRRTIIITDRIIVKVKLREKSNNELVKEELETLKSAMVDLAQTTNKTTTAKINTILSKGVS